DLETIVAPIRDISQGGFKFLHDHPVPLGEQFALVLPEEGGHTIAILCTVAYWQPLAEGLFAIGARFCQVLREGQAGLPLIFEDAVSGERVERMAS
ncbi:MAG TPA: PilZ domain-containing protein, partial [Tepidisphaeraceae bacterium]|nr:PilZ domain-containing protein [Tepidisphaeraceae bacterium]